jgi:hypothetical protein
VPTGIEPDANASLVGHRHPGHGFAISLPDGWQVRLDEPAGVALLGVEPEADPWGFRTNVVVTVEDLNDEVTLAGWQAGATALLPETLTDYLLLDLQSGHVGERAGLRRLAHHDADGRAVTMEQWATIEGARGFTLTASVSTLDYPGVSVRLAAIARTFQIRTHPTRRQIDTDG